MTRVQFYGVLLLMGATGLYLGLKAPPEAETVTRSLANEQGSHPSQNSLTSALERVNALAQAPAAQAAAPVPVPAPATPPPEYSIGAQLAVLPPAQAMDTALQQLSANTLSSHDRVDVIDFIREHENESADRINRAVLDELSDAHLSRVADDPEFVKSYIVLLANVFLETQHDPEKAMVTLVDTASSYQDDLSRKALVGTFAAQFPAMRTAIEQALRDHSLDPAQVLDPADPAQIPPQDP